ncbi:hypothetical protein [Murimonas intestini]|uniref:hypothetical protein n=1 Tax=Murimonas intestini TaxID=1337051 RepID=UPI00248ACB72|nr:hypothetical protein [Murimonas intestini]
MYQSSAAFGDLIQQDSRTFYSYIMIDGKTRVTEGIKSIRLNGASNSDESFNLGSVVSQYIEIELASSMQEIENHVLDVYIGMDVNGASEYIPLGHFTAGKPQRDEGNISITAYDNIMKTERAYFSKLPDDTGTIPILEEITSLTGVSIDRSNLDNIVMKKPSGYTCREVLGYIAQLYGGFVICNRTGEIQIRQYSDPGYVVGPERYWDSFLHNEFMYEVQKITCYTGNDAEGNSISISVGSGGRNLSFSNPFMTQDTLNKVYASLKGWSYMPGSIRMLGDPRLDPWDIVTVTDLNGIAYKVPCMTLVQDFDGGLTTEIEAVGESETENEQDFKGPTTKMIERYSIQLALVDHAIVNKLDVDTANITYAKIKDLDATNAKIQNLDAVYAKIENLTAANAKINNLEANYGNIHNLLSGNAGIGDLVNIHLTSQNAMIETALIKNIVSSNITVNDLLAGRISTNRFEVSSDDGGIKITGATQQWKDKKGTVRMQAGLDAKGDFTFSLFDAAGGGVLIDAAGIHPGAVPDGLIVDDMVADGANISGSKLDINSVIGQYNAKGTVTIKGTKIYLDEQQQNLSAAFSNLSAGVQGVNNKVTTIEAGISGINLEMSQLREDIDGIVVNDGSYILQTFVKGGHVGTTDTAQIIAKVLSNNKDITKQIPSNRFLWVRHSEDVSGDNAWNEKQITGYTLSLAGKDVSMVATFSCLLTIPDEFNIIGLDGSSISGLDGSEMIGLYV